MNMNKIMSLARKNQNEASNHKKIGYSTQVKPPKKLERTVNPDAVKAFLNRKKEIEEMQIEESKKKKKELQKLREDKKNTKRAKAMATRTKDNLKILYNQKPVVEKRDEIILSPEAEQQHKAFMKRLMASEVQDKESSSDDEGGGRSVELERKAIRKSEKYQKKARKAANLDFQDLMNLAQEQSQQTSSNSSENTSDEECSSDGMSVEERLEKEKKRRKLLEAQLKALKRKKNKNSTSEPAYKIGKLDKGLSEEDKQAKVKALMNKFKKRSQEKNGVSKASEKVNNTRTTSLNSLPGSKKNSSSYSKVAASQNTQLTSSKPTLSSKTKNSSVKASDLNDRTKKSSRPHTPPTKTKHSAKSALSSSKKLSSKHSSLPKTNFERTAKKASNPYAELMQKAKANQLTKSSTNVDKKCTLSVTNSSVRTNYPGVSSTDPKRPTYEKVAPSREMIEAYRRRRSMLQHPSHKRPQVIEDSDDEYDSEMEGFIDDEEDEEEDMPDDISAEIGKIFRYDKSKYGRESEYELSKMDASYKDIEREEKRSLKIAQREDAIEAKRLEEEELRKRKRLKK